MGIIDDMIINAKSAADAVGRKAEQLVDYSKIKMSISDITNELNKKYKELGLFVYNSEINKSKNEELYKAKIDKIKDLNEQLDATNQLLMEAKNKKRCSSCGQINDKDYFFCYKCGAKLPEDSTEKKEEAADTNTNTNEAPSPEPVQSSEQTSASQEEKEE